MRILVATDGSPASDIALDSVADRPWEAGTVIEIVTAEDLRPDVAADETELPAAYLLLLDRAKRARAEWLVASARTRVASRADGLAVATKVLNGSPARAVLAEAEAWDADLIVVGSHGRGAAGRFPVGSVSHAIATHAPCSVEVARRRAGA